MNGEINREALVQKVAAQKKLDPAKLREWTDLSRKEKKTIFQVLVDQDVWKEEEMIDFLSEELSVPILNLSSYRIPKEIIQLVPKKLADKHQIVPLACINHLLSVATTNPLDLILRDDLKEITKCEVIWVLASPKMLTNAIDNYYGESSNLAELLDGIDDENVEVIKQAKPAGDGDKDDGDTGAAGAQEAPVIRMVNLILDGAIRSRASDIHFEPYENDFRVRYRIDGSLKESFSHARDMYGPLVARIKIMSQLNITERRVPQDGRFRAKISGKEIDFRVSVLPTYHGEKVVLRVLDKGGLKSGLAQLGFTEKPTAIFAEAIKKPYGMILVTGPTGSGKSTTLYTILNTMNTPERNIMTIEDPVEYQVEGITQTQTHAGIGLTFAGGLRTLLRQSPDIILVGEIRDTETADIGVKAALTGHLVFSTLHTNSAAGAMTRLMDMGIEPFLIASSVICVAAQRLMRKVCQYCKAPCEIPEELLRRCGITAEDLQGIVTYKGKGCAKCNETGYYGRLGSIEVLKMSPDIRTLVMQRKSSDIIERKAVELGMETLFENAFGLFKSGLTTIEEVLRVTSKG